MGVPSPKGSSGFNFLDTGTFQEVHAVVAQRLSIRSRYSEGWSDYPD